MGHTKEFAVPDDRKRPTVRLAESDQKDLDFFKEEFGVSHWAEVVRLGLKVLRDLPPEQRRALVRKHKAN